MAPDVGEIAGDAGQGDDVDGGFDGTLGDEEEGHPEEVKAELDGVEGCALFEEDELFGRGEGVHSCAVSAVGGVAHEAVEDGPGGAEDLGWWAIWGLLECHVGFLGFLCWGGG